MNTKTQKAINYGSNNYATIVSDATSDVPVAQSVQTAITFPATLVESFFSIVNGNAIQFSNNGYVQITFKANVSSGGGILDLQVVKNGIPMTNGRRQFKTNTYIEASFYVPIMTGDLVQIKASANVDDMVFEIVAPVSDQLVEQKPYMLALEFTNMDTNVGELFFSTDGTLASKNNVIKLWGSVTLLKADYPILWSKLQSTPLISGSDTDSFTIADMANSRYIAAANTVFIAQQNLPNPVIVGTGAGTVSFGTTIEGGGMSNKAGFLSNSTLTIGGTWGGEAAAGSGLSLGVVNLDIASHTHTIDNDSGSYSTEQEVRPNTLQTFLYIRCDIQ